MGSMGSVLCQIVPSLFFFLSIFISLWAAPGFSFVACGIQFPDEGLNPGPLHQEHAVLATGPPGKSPTFTV